MPTPKKSKKQVRVYLDTAEEGMLSEAMTAFPGWTETDVTTLILAAGLRALKEAQNRFEWPLRFTPQRTQEGVRYQVNEPTPPARKR